ncbi:hypothetical protein Ae201684_018001 [Aphanomyces euteiches]|uniref:CW-type domain-containing protein n=1 Tax=Aphanomyces euteiches TaxID=100861 RepID=A0A6G0W9Q6_9STRA|nr:hypothetical protein Ae201684_018001 [Aphanomyces euteiches]
MADSDGDTKHESKKKDKKKKKKKDKKKDKKQKKEKKSGGKSKDDSSDDETSEPPLPAETKVEPSEESVASSIPLAATAHSPDSPPHKLDLNIVIPNKDRDSDDSKTAESVRNKKKSKKKKRARASETTSTSGNDVEEADEAKWVQCDRCKKWRTVPEDVDLDKISQTAWYCTMNSWDSKYASCDVAEEVVEPKAKKAKLDSPTDEASPLKPSSTSLPASFSSVETPKREAEKKDKSKLGKKLKAKMKVQVKHVSKLTPTAVSSPIKSESTEVKWVQCENNSCGKWRVVPPHIDIASLPLKWFCSLNTWAPALATCAAENPVEVESLWNKKSAKPVVPKSSAKAGGRSSPRGKTSPREQVAFPAIPTVLDVIATSGDIDSPMGKGKKIKSPEKTVLEWAMCDKCKKWRKLPAHVKSATLPEHWFCSMNHWNPVVASCSAPQEADTETTATARIPVPIPRPAVRRGKLSYRELLYAGNGHIRKAYTPESSTLSFEFEGKMYHRDDQYRKSSLYSSPTIATAADNNEIDDSPSRPDENTTLPTLSKAELDKLRYLLQSLVKVDDGKSILDMVAMLHNEKNDAKDYYSYAAVYQTVQAMVQDGDMEAYRDERMVTVTVPTKVSTYAEAYYVAGEHNTELRTWEERRTSPHLLYRRKIQYKLPLKVSKPWKQKGFSGWINK